MHERELIDALQRIFTQRDPRVVRGIGDDASVVRGRGYAVTSLDAMVDGIHFRSRQLSGEEIGHRALAAALSDLAAMAADPGEAYLMLGLPGEEDPDVVIAIAQGAQSLASSHGVVVAGGDVTRASSLTVSFTVVGWAEDPGRLVGRDGAQPGNVVVVTGRLGGAGAGLALFDDRARLEGGPAGALRERYSRPQPRFAAARQLAGLGAGAMIDISDGLATDAGHIANCSKVGLELSLAALPLDDGVEEVANQLHEDPGRFAATAGEDYELCACIPGPALETALASGATEVGRVVDGAGTVVFSDADEELSGYEHSF